MPRKVKNKNKTKNNNNNKNKNKNFLKNETMNLTRLLYKTAIFNLQKVNIRFQVGIILVTFHFFVTINLNYIRFLGKV